MPWHLPMLFLVPHVNGESESARHSLYLYDYFIHTRTQLDVTYISSPHTECINGFKLQLALIVPFSAKNKNLRGIEKRREIALATTSGK